MEGIRKMFRVTQEQVDALEIWVRDRREAYLRKGFQMAAVAGATPLAAYAADGGLKPEDTAKSVMDLKKEYDLAEMFHRDAKQILHAGRQGG
jgi:chromosome condensin MukBEF complex kleisin-like MukF subunit|tara:strand:- start:826 stop:1101 length:276 start_codon:yes stop_codon:yes gene_type:complete